MLQILRHHKNSMNEMGMVIAEKVKGIIIGLNTE
jgi:hypothetical protein